MLNLIRGFDLDLDEQRHERATLRTLLLAWMALASTVCVFGVALALALYPLQAHPQDITQPTLLVAAPNLQGPYRGTVLFAAPGVQGVHVGLILNRPSKVRMAELFPAHAPCTEVRDPVYFGGPEMQDAIFALVRGESPHPSSLQVAPGVWLVHNGSAVDRVIEATPNAARYFAGFVVWRPGELAEELRSRYFIRQPLDVEKLFRPDTSTLYEELAPRKGQVDA